MKTNRFLLAAGVMLALAFTFGCSSDGGNSADGGGNSSVTGGADGGGNQDSQVYIYPNKDGVERTLFTDGGIIETEYGEVRVGSITNGIVKLELPENIPNEYLVDFGKGSQGSCSFPKDLKGTSGFVLTNNDKVDLGELFLHYSDGQIREDVTYYYFSEAVKMTCNYDACISGSDDSCNEYEKRVYTIDAKKGWNKQYRVRTYATEKEPRKTEYSTNNNILTKEVKWVIQLNN